MAATQGTGPTLLIPPGQFGFVYTEERVVIPANVIAFISIKAGAKFKGLVNVSGFHVDPGFRGRLKFSVYNAGNQPICLDYGRPYFIIWFSELDKPTRDPYDGGYQNQNGVTAEDREQMSEGRHSPAALAKRVESLERLVNVSIGVGVTIAAAVVLPLLVGIAVVVFQHWFEEKKASEPKTTPGQTNVISSTQALPPSPNAPPKTTGPVPLTKPTPNNTNVSAQPLSR